MSAKILVVDDEPDLEHLVRQKFRRQIRDNEFEFQFAQNGVQALECLLPCIVRTLGLSVPTHEHSKQVRPNALFRLIANCIDHFLSEVAIPLNAQLGNQFIHASPDSFKRITFKQMPKVGLQ